MKCWQEVAGNVDRDSNLAHRCNINPKTKMQKVPMVDIRT